MSADLSLPDEIENNRNALEVPVQITELRTEGSSVDVRLRGAFITDCELTSPTTGERVSILYSDEDISKPKVSATHAMVPYGPYDGVGGQHGFPRWADYEHVTYGENGNGVQHVILEAKQSDRSLSLVRSIDLSPDSITIKNTVSNAGHESRDTSIGEHAYFKLMPHGDPSELLIDRKNIDTLFGQGSAEELQNDGTLYWEFPDNQAVITFPDGHKVKIEASFMGDTKYPLALLVWRRQGTASICFEPVVGVGADEANDGVKMPPQGSASLCTKISIL